MYQGLENDRIEIRAGARFRGTQISVNDVLNSLGSNNSVEAVLEEFPALTREDIAAAREYEKAGVRLRVKQWSNAAPRLQAIEWRELREMTDEEHRRTIGDLLALAPVSDDPHPTSGLAEFQRRLRSKA